MDIEIDDVVALDRLNMEPILKSSGIQFDEKKHRLDLEKDIARGGEFISIYQNKELAGYLFFIADDDGIIFVHSIQIHPNQRNGAVLRQLLKAGLHELKNYPDYRVRSSVHKSNLPSIRFHEKLGFKRTSADKQKIYYEVSSKMLSGKIRY